MSIIHFEYKISFTLIFSMPVMRRTHKKEECKTLQYTPALVSLQCVYNLSVGNMLEKLSAHYINNPLRRTSLHNHKYNYLNFSYFSLEKFIFYKLQIFF